MTALELQVLLPLLILAGTVLLLLMVAAFHEDRGLSAWLAVAGQTAALVGLVLPARHAPLAVGSLLVMDGYGLFFVGLILAAGVAVTVLSQPFLDRSGLRNEEFHIVLLLGVLGAAVLVVSTHFASLFLGLELLTVSLYVMIAYHYRAAESLEAAVKYLILAAVSSAFLLFGMALVYAEVGTLEFGELGRRLLSEPQHPVIIVAGTGFLVAGIGFKLAVVPFHFWTPDVYEGAPASVTGFLATISKGAVVALLLRYVLTVDLWSVQAVFVTFGVIAAASMLAGNVLALFQQNVKRMIAYGSIGHLGYVLVAMLAGEASAAEAVTFYVVAYVAATLGIFGLIGHGTGLDREAAELADLRGLFWRQPLLAGMFTVFLLSLVGLPLTGGFMGKFFVVRAAVGSGLWVLVFLVVATSVIGLFYYLRVVAGLYAGADEPWADRGAVRERRPGSLPATGMLAMLTVIVLWLGVYPSPVLELIQRVVVLGAG
jgi:NADH-quinone oxidoreductase subunit N